MSGRVTSTELRSQQALPAVDAQPPQAQTPLDALRARVHGQRTSLAMRFGRSILPPAAAPSSPSLAPPSQAIATTPVSQIDGRQVTEISLTRMIPAPTPIGAISQRIQTQRASLAMRFGRSILPARGVASTTPAVTTPAVTTPAPLLLLRSNPEIVTAFEMTTNTLHYVKTLLRAHMARLDRTAAAELQQRIDNVSGQTAPALKSLFAGLIIEDILTKPDPFGAELMPHYLACLIDRLSLTNINVIRATYQRETAQSQERIRRSLLETGELPAGLAGASRELATQVRAITQTLTSSASFQKFSEVILTSNFPALSANVAQDTVIRRAGDFSSYVKALLRAHMSRLNAPRALELTERLRRDASSSNAIIVRLILEDIVTSSENPDVVQSCFRRYPLNNIETRPFGEFLPRLRNFYASFSAEQQTHFRSLLYLSSMEEHNLLELRGFREIIGSIFVTHYSVRAEFSPPDLGLANFFSIVSIMSTSQVVNGACATACREYLAEARPIAAPATVEAPRTEAIRAEAPVTVRELLPLGELTTGEGLRTLNDVRQDYLRRGFPSAYYTMLLRLHSQRLDDVSRRELSQRMGNLTDENVNVISNILVKLMIEHAAFNGNTNFSTGDLPRHMTRVSLVADISMAFRILSPELKAILRAKLFCIDPSRVREPAQPQLNALMRQVSDFAAEVMRADVDLIVHTRSVCRTPLLTAIDVSGAEASPSESPVPSPVLLPLEELATGDGLRSLNEMRGLELQRNTNHQYYRTLLHLHSQRLDDVSRRELSQRTNNVTDENVPVVSNVLVKLLIEHTAFNDNYLYAWDLPFNLSPSIDQLRNINRDYRALSREQKAVLRMQIYRGGMSSQQPVNALCQRINELGAQIIRDDATLSNSTRTACRTVLLNLEANPADRRMLESTRNGGIVEYLKKLLSIHLTRLKPEKKEALLQKISSTDLESLSEVSDFFTKLIVEDAISQRNEVVSDIAAEPILGQIAVGNTSMSDPTTSYVRINAIRRLYQDLDPEEKDLLRLQLYENAGPAAIDAEALDAQTCWTQAKEFAAVIITTRPSFSNVVHVVCQQHLSANPIPSTTPRADLRPLTLLAATDGLRADIDVQRVSSLPNYLNALLNAHIARLEGADAAALKLKVRNLNTPENLSHVNELLIRLVIEDVMTTTTELFAREEETPNDSATRTRIGATLAAQAARDSGNVPVDADELQSHNAALQNQAAVREISYLSQAQREERLRDYQRVENVPSLLTSFGARWPYYTMVTDLKTRYGALNDEQKALLRAHLHSDVAPPGDATSASYQIWQRVRGMAAQILLDKPNFNGATRFAVQRYTTAHPATPEELQADEQFRLTQEFRETRFDIPVAMRRAPAADYINTLIARKFAIVQRSDVDNAAQIVLWSDLSRPTPATNSQIIGWAIEDAISSRTRLTQESCPSVLTSQMATGLVLLRALFERLSIEDKKAVTDAINSEQRPRSEDAFQVWRAARAVATRTNTEALQQSLAAGIRNYLTTATRPIAPVPEVAEVVEPDPGPPNAAKVMEMWTALRTRAATIKAGILGVQRVGDWAPYETHDDTIKLHVALIKAFEEAKRGRNGAYFRRLQAGLSATTGTYENNFLPVQAKLAVAYFMTLPRTVPFPPSTGDHIAAINFIGMRSLANLRTDYNSLADDAQKALVLGTLFDSATPPRTALYNRPAPARTLFENWNNYITPLFQHNTSFNNAILCALATIEAEPAQADPPEEEIEAEPEREETEESSDDSPRLTSVRSVHGRRSFNDALSQIGRADGSPFNSDDDEDEDGGLSLTARVEATRRELV